MNLQVGSGLGFWAEGLGAIGFRGLGFRVQDFGFFSFLLFCRLAWNLL